jgi:Fe-S cluster assembly ATP-binding protein
VARDVALGIEQLTVEVEGREILHGINLEMGLGETHVLFGPNGSGKTTLLMTIMGFPKYRVTKGKIILKGRDITMLPLDERARLGIGMSFQRPPVVRGVKTRDMVAACLRGREQKESISQLAEKANLADFLDREINYGFSGGEIKRSELMQLLAQRPALTLIDEPESGVDLVNIALIGELLNSLLEKNVQYPSENARGSLLPIPVISSTMLMPAPAMSCVVVQSGAQETPMRFWLLLERKATRNV